MPVFAFHSKGYFILIQADGISRSQNTRAHTSEVGIVNYVNFQGHIPLKYSLHVNSL